MNIDITARHDTLNDALRTHVNDRFEHALRLADDVTSVHVILDHERARHSAEVVVHGRNLAAAVHADGDDHFLAIDRCADKLRHQLEHHLGRRRDKRRRSPGLKAVEAEVAAAASAQASGIVPPAPAPGTTATQATGKDATAGIVRTSPSEIAAMSVEAARRELEESALEFLLFIDESSKALSVIFRRHDGQLGLVETGAA